MALVLCEAKFLGFPRFDFLGGFCLGLDTARGEQKYISELDIVFFLKKKYCCVVVSDVDIRISSPK